LHLRIREALGLAALGFRSEQTVEGLLVDELHWRARLVVEVNGDLVHANPALYGPEDMIVLGDKQYTAQTKWMSDLRKQQHLRSRGYRVLVVWESDDLDAVRVELARLLTSPP
jgi:very-short-patch-repair endonuclease